MIEQPDTPPEPEDLRALSLEEILARPTEKPTFPEQNADGVDLSLIRSNLKVSVEDRIRRGDRGRAMAEDVQRHVRTIALD